MSETQTETAVKKEVEVVKMSDGRQVEFVGKRKLLKEHAIDEENGNVMVRLDFRNGETRTFTVPTGLMLKFAAHGAEQKLGDETAGVQDVDDMVLYIDELIERLDRGEWSTKREGSPFAGASILMRALVEVSGKTPDQVKAFLKTKSAAEKMALRNSSKLKPVVDRLEAEKASKGSKVDTEALLGELEM